MKTHRFKYAMIICMAVAFWAALLASPAPGAPIHYTVQFTVGRPNPDYAADPMSLENSQFTVEYEWDASSLVPTSDEPKTFPYVIDRATVWPATNTIYKLTITGSGVDGIYAGTGDVGDTWLFHDNERPSGNLYDMVQFPDVYFNLPGYTIYFGGLIARFPGAFNTPASPGTVFPFPFQASDVTYWQSPSIEYVMGSDYIRHQGLSVSGSAAVVPIPGALILFGTGLLRLAAWGRRRKE